MKNLQVTFGIRALKWEISGSLINGVIVAKKLKKSKKKIDKNIVPPNECPDCNVSPISGDICDEHNKILDKVNNEEMDL